MGDEIGFFFFENFFFRFISKEMMKRVNLKISHSFILFLLSFQVFLLLLLLRYYINLLVCENFFFFLKFIINSRVNNLIKKVVERERELVISLFKYILELIAY